MRATLRIDDDLAGLLKRRARELGRPFKDVVNGAIRTALAEHARPKAHTAPRTIPHSFGFRPGIDLDKLNPLVDGRRARSRNLCCRPAGGAECRAAVRAKLSWPVT
jgi:hypothetical protein